MVLAQDNTGYFKIKDSYIEVIETSYPEYISLVKKENGKEEVAGQVKIVDQYLISDLPENEFLDEYSYLKEGFQDLTISLETDQPLFEKESFYYSPSLLDKTKSFFGFETLPEYRITKEIDKSASVQTELDLSGISLTTHYQESGSWNLESGVKQSLTLTNNSEEDLNLSLLLRNQIDANKVYWNGEYYPTSENPRKFSNPDKIAFYSQDEKHLSFYDFSDIPDEFSPELWVENKDSQTILILSLNIFIPQNSSKTIDPEYSSLKAEEELPEKTTISSKTYIKTLPDLTKTFTWEGTIGARYFKDDGQWYSHLLIDDRPNKVVLRNAKVAVEVYPSFAKYFDVDYQEERVKKEKWLLERKVGERWENIELASPIMEIIQGEHSAGDYIGVKKIYNTGFGIFEIEYFLRDGNALKHTITFQNSSGSTETFRVIQKWEGIAGNKVNGKDVPLETDSPYLAFHYAEDDPKDFTVSENLSSMMFNGDGTEKTEECLQRPVKIDKDIQGMKTDFIYGNWTLAQDENLEIDPDTATLSDPTEDGLVSYHVDSPYECNRDKTITILSVSYSARWRYRSYVEWDIESIPDGASITNVVFRYHGKENSGDAYIREMVGCQPSEQADDKAGNTAIYDEIIEGTIYYDTAGFPEVGTNKSADLGASADSDLQNQLALDWFAIGLDGPMDTVWAHIYSEESTDPVATPPPTLYVEYTLPLGASCDEPSDCTSGNCTSEGMCCVDGYDGACWASNDPTVDGHTWFQDATYYDIDNTNAELKVGTVHTSMEKNYRIHIEWDVESIPDGCTITDTVFKYHGSTNNVDAHIHEMLDYQPSLGSAGTINSEAGEGAVYADVTGFPVVGIGKEIDLGSSADSDLASQLSSDWFAIGIQSDDEGTAILSTIYSENKDPTADPKPTLYVEYSTNTAPTVSSVSLNSGNDINLTANDTTSVSATANISDDQGCDTISTVEAKIYRSGATNGKDCTADKNDCYSVATCTETSCVGTDAVYTCTINMEYYADPTDAGTYVDQNWRAWVKATDSGALTGEGDSPTGTLPDVKTQLAFSLSTASINYGEMSLGTNTGASNQTVNIINTGNVRMDVMFDGYGAGDGDGKAMVCDTGSIIIGNEKYDISDVTYDSLTWPLTDSAEERDWDVLQRTEDSAKTQGQDQKWSYWGLAIPAEGVGGTCSGSANFTAVNDAAGD